MFTENLEQFLDGVYKFFAEINEQIYMKETSISLSEVKTNFAILKEKLKEIKKILLSYCVMLA